MREIYKSFSMMDRLAVDSRQLTVGFRYTQCLAVIVVLACLISCSNEENRTSYPNVLFISIDDLNDWVDPIGAHPQSRTPNISRVAEKGVTFINAHAASPLCNPSRVSLLTGLHPHRTGIVSNNAFYPFRDHLPEAETMVQHFKREGYRTVGFGKIFHRDDSGTEPWDFYKKHSKRPKPETMPAHEINYLTDSVYRFFDWSKMPQELDAWGEHRMASAAIEELGRRQDDPFFMAVGFRLPHLAWYYPQAFDSIYAGAGIELPVWKEDDLKDVGPMAIEKIKNTIVGHDLIMIQEKWEEAVKAYLATIAFLDWELGRIIDALENSEHAENTIIVIWGDHGFHLGEKSFWRKNMLWDRSSRTTLVMSVPDTESTGSKTNEVVSLLDLYPTLASLCGLTPRNDLDGMDLSPVLRDPSASLEREYISIANQLGSAIRTKEARYIRYTDGFEELYDHIKDPNEWENLANDPAYLNLKNQLSDYLDGDLEKHTE